MSAAEPGIISFLCVLTGMVAGMLLCNSLAVCALSVGGVIFLIEETNKPLGGMVKVSIAPLLKAIE